MIKRVAILATLILTISTRAFAQDVNESNPRLVVNIIVGGMRANDIDKYSSNLSKDGFLHLQSEGSYFTNSSYDCQQTLTPVSLATLASGATPSTHGVVGHAWYDYVTNERVSLIECDTVRNLEFDSGVGFSAANLIAPTLGETLSANYKDSRIVSIAVDPSSAIVLSGGDGACFWLDSRSCHWATSTAYFPVLPAWVQIHNNSEVDMIYLDSRWSNYIISTNYINTINSDITISGRVNKSSVDRVRAKTHADRTNEYYNRMCYTPAGNRVVLEFAKQAIANYNLGDDDAPDMLNISLDSSRKIVEKYGPESMEAEDALYRLDGDIAEFINYVKAQVGDDNVLFVVTSDGGVSPSVNQAVGSVGVFNSRQFEVILNGFLSARYGSGDWVLGCENNNVYLNHNTIYSNGLVLEDVQNETAIFAMQFGGIAQALTSTAMRSSYFASGYAEKIQNSFYPRRSGDVIVNLMPGWIEYRDGVVASAGSMYRYDTQVPLIFYGANIPKQRIDREVEMIDVAPTIARMLQMEAPAATEGKPIVELDKYRDL